MTGIVIPVFDRPGYVKQTYNSLQKAHIPKNTIIYIADDGSTEETILLIPNFNPGCPVKTVYNYVNIGNHIGIKAGFNYLYSQGCDIVMTLDSDAIVKPNFIEVITGLVNRFPESITSGFNTLVHHPGKPYPRHPILKQETGYCIKKSSGGINLAMKEPMFRQFLEPSLTKNWDWNLSHLMQKHKRYFIISTPSVVQHIGIDSSMQHICPDVAKDF